LYDVLFEHKDTPYVMRAYHVSFFEGELDLKEHLQIHWVSLGDLASYCVPEPDKPTNAYLQENFQ